MNHYIKLQGIILLLGVSPLLRLFGTLGLITLLSAAMALTSDQLFFQVSTVVLGVGSVWLYLWLRRSVPVRSGSIKIPGLQGPVEVYRDDHGVPHIYARSMHDLYMAQGYVTAQDRLWSMDLQRRRALGHLAEIFGDRAVALDRQMRTLGFGRVARASFESYTSEMQEHLTCYANGVNAFIRQGPLSLEFTVLRYRPEEWSPQDTIAISKFTFSQSGQWWGDTLLHAELVQSVGAEKAAELFTSRPDLDWLEVLEQTLLPDFDLALAKMGINPWASSGGSCWAVLGSKTQSGLPLLATSLHSGVEVPASCYEVHLNGPSGLDVAGVTYPGIPGVVMGQTGTTAWGLTPLKAPSLDLYLVDVNAEQVMEEIETIQIADSAPEEIRLRRTCLGPILASDETTAIALRWTALEPSTELAGIFQMNRAHNWSEFRASLQGFDGPAWNVTFASRDGTIASRTVGCIPMRAKGDGLTPIPGNCSDYEWQGYLPFEELPEHINPEGGVLITAEPPWSKRRLTERLRGAQGLNLEKATHIQADRINVHARSILQTLLTAANEGLRHGSHPDVLSPFEKSALLALSGWDFEESGTCAAPLIWHQWYLFLMESIFRHQMGLTLFNRFAASDLGTVVTDRVVQLVAKGGDSLWMGREGENGLYRIALRSLRRTLALLSAKHGNRIERWRWDREHKVRLIHPLTIAVPSLGVILNSGPHGMGGSGSTLRPYGYNMLDPFAVTSALAWGQAVDLWGVEQSQRICPPGSGHALSPNYADQGSLLNHEPQSRLFRSEAVKKLPRLLLEP